MFEHLNGQNMKVYIDDIIVKSKEDVDHPADLHETFTGVCNYRIKLNPKKCIFKMRFGKFLGFMISSQGIEAKPYKVEVVLSIKPPRNIMEVQRLIGCVAMHKCIMSKSADKC